jgi:hypothetical protein
VLVVYGPSPGIVAAVLAADRETERIHVEMFSPALSAAAWSSSRSSAVVRTLIRDSLLGFA